jgi:hypothetical protein
MRVRLSATTIDASNLAYPDTTPLRTFARNLLTANV